MAQLDSLSFVLSRRGKPQLYYQGYLFNSDSVKNGRVYWRCSETRRGSCMARLLTTSTNLIEKQPIHDHQPNNRRIEGKRIISFTECHDYYMRNMKAEIQAYSMQIQYLTEAK